MFGTVPEVYSRTDELEEMGLTVPQITKIFRSLHDRGFDVSPSVFTVSQGADELMRYFEGREWYDKRYHYRPVLFRHLSYSPHGRV